jgi:UDP-N-acetylmuramyl pentapeptide phosphotransferase/UDP-N-acetylglucosamine-1-phosphate transferase
MNYTYNLEALFIFISTVFLINILNFLFKKLNFCIDNLEYSKHKIVSVNEKIPLTLGFILVVFSCNFFSEDFKIIIFFLSIFFLGLFSDLNLLNNAYKKFLFQFIFILLFVISVDLTISTTRITLLDNLLIYSIFSYFFSTFCLMILINGKNFIDGMNGLVIINSLLIFLILILTADNYNLELDKKLYQNFIYVLSTMLIFNFLGKSFLGDNGSFLIGAIIGYLIIIFYHNNPTISPFFILVLLWYPAFEILFSIIRKLIQKKSPFKPDSLHLHQLIFLAFNKKKEKKRYFNNLTSITINFFNFMFYFSGSFFIYSTKKLILLIFLYSLSYLFIYKSLYKLQKDNKNN